MTLNPVCMMKKYIALLIICLGLTPATISKAVADKDLLPFQNADLTPHERAIDLLGRLTLEEKAQLMRDISEAVPRLGIKTFNWWSEALHGVA